MVETLNLPATRVTAPVNVFVPESVKVPVPTFAKLPAPDIAPEYVLLLLSLPADKV